MVNKTLTALLVLALSACNAIDASKVDDHSDHSTNDSNNTTITNNGTKDGNTSNGNNDDANATDGNNTTGGVIALVTGINQGKAEFKKSGDNVYFTVVYGCLRANTKVSVSASKGTPVVEREYTEDMARGKKYIVTGFVPYSEGLTLKANVNWGSTGQLIASKTF